MQAFFSQGGQPRDTGRIAQISLSRPIQLTGPKCGCRYLGPSNTLPGAYQYSTRGWRFLRWAWITRDWVMAGGRQFLPDISRRSHTTPFTPPGVVRFAGPRAGHADAGPWPPPAPGEGRRPSESRPGAA